MGRESLRERGTIALLLSRAKDDAAGYDLQIFQAPGGRGWGFYKEIRDLTGFDRNCVHTTSLLCLVFRVVPGS